MEKNALTDLLIFLTNDRSLFRFVEQITGCGRIGMYDGRVYRMLPGSEHYDSWHDDVAEQRLLALSVNLSPEQFSGGRLEIRNLRTGRVVIRLANTGPGDGLVFRVAPFLKHRVTRVTGAVAKTALAGWFRSSPAFHSEIHSHLSRLRSGSVQ